MLHVFAPDLFFTRFSRGRWQVFSHRCVPPIRSFILPIKLGKEGLRNKISREVHSLMHQEHALLQKAYHVLQQEYVVLPQEYAGLQQESQIILKKSYKKSGIINTHPMTPQLLNHPAHRMILLVAG